MQSKVWQKLREISFINDLLGLAVLSLDQFCIRPATLHFVLIFLKHCLKDFIKPICRNAWCVKPDDCKSKSIRNRQIPLPPLPRHLEIKFWNLYHCFYAALVEILLKYFTPSFKWVCHCKTSGRELCKFGGIWHVQIWMFPEGTCFITIKAVQPVWRLRRCLILNKTKCGHPMLHLGTGPIFTIFRLITGLEASIRHVLKEFQPIFVKCGIGEFSVKN